VDELTAPLGQSVPPRRRFSVPRAIAIALIAALFGVGLWMALTKHPFRDTPVAVSPAPQQVQADTPVVPPRVEADPTGAVREPPGGGQRTVTIIDGMSGKRQEVVIGLPEPAPSAPPGQKRSR